MEIKKMSERLAIATVVVGVTLLLSIITGLAFGFVIKPLFTM